MTKSERRAIETALSLPYMPFHEQVAYLRALDWSQQRIGDYLGVSQPTVSNACAGLPAPRQRRVRRASRAADDA